MTNFFSQLKELGLQSANLEIRFNETGETVVIIKPGITCKEKSMQNLSPLVIKTNDVDSMDSDFFDVIEKPVVKLVEADNEFRTFEAELEIAKQNSEAGKKKAEKEKKEKEEAKKKVESAEKVLKAIVETDGFDIKKEKEKVQKAVTKIIELDDKNKLALEYQEKLKEAEMPSLFETGELDNI